MIKGYERQEGLLFYMSGDAGLTAEFAKGQAAPNFAFKAEPVPEGGADGGYVRCDDFEAYSYLAPGNMYASRGTLSFFWRSRYPVGPTEFPLFRAGYVDHTSWDACFLRIDYNGHGLDAFVTDLNLSRARVSVTLDPFPAPDEWMHVAFSWDENFGVKLYVNGEKKAELFRPGMYAAGLDQFGPHARAVSHWNVSSMYNFIRGGDIDEIAVFDRMLSDGNVSALARLQMPGAVPALNVTLNDPLYRNQWFLRCGFNRDDRPRAMKERMVVRKVGIADAYDLKRWYWKACDGIRETTWPGTFNRSRLTGRNDYYQLPDWDCYSGSGKTVTFTIPEHEKFNHIEIAGSAYGQAVRVEVGQEGALLFNRPQHQERTFHDTEDMEGGAVRFTNTEIEEPIGDFSVFYVHEGSAPADAVKKPYRLIAGHRENAPAERELYEYITGRYAPYERNVYTGVPADGGLNGTFRLLSEDPFCGYPQYNVILPYEEDGTLGLDGIEITFPKGLSGRLSVQVRDPLVYYRNLLHYTLELEGLTGSTVFFDTRDRILPEGKCLYLVICAEERIPLGKFSVSAVYKRAEKCVKEHCEDRFLEVRDVYGHITEESPRTTKLRLRKRYDDDLNDLLRVKPDHELGLLYKYAAMSRYFTINEQTGEMVFVGSNNRKNGGEDDTTPKEAPVFAPPVMLPEAPEGTPSWAFEQIEFLKRYKRLINFYVDKRQIGNGEFGGGLSDDGDFTASWVPLIQMDSDAKKMLKSLVACTDAFYEQGMFTNGLCTIQADELHSSEEGLISVGQVLSAAPWNPQYLEHVMETARAIPWLSGVNKAGHRHIRSSYYSGTKMAQEMPWGMTRPNSFIAISPVWLLTRYNGSPLAKKWMLELADGMMAHYHDGKLHGTVCYETDEELDLPGGSHGNAIHTLLYAAYRQTGNEGYLKAIGDFGFTPARVSGVLDKETVARKYRNNNLVEAVREYYNTLGSPWIDRVYFEVYDIQYDRLGGAGHMRFRAAYPRNGFSWTFDHEGDDEKLAILTPWQAEDRLKLLVWNDADAPVRAALTGAEILPGTWKITSGIDTDGDDLADSGVTEETVHWEPYADVRVCFAPKAVTVVELSLTEASGDHPRDRYDLGISEQDVKEYAHGFKVTVHSLGALDTPEAKIVLKSPEGRILDEAVIPPLEAPADLHPRTWEVSLHLWNVKNRKGCTIEIDPENALHETTRKNNTVTL
ncbi:MAG: hypothetical protein J6Z38_00255 [Lachnospiraceae bacterium]|nr:hypothetical protein [Lachnospiraceae bacterium]